MNGEMNGLMDDNMENSTSPASDFLSHKQSSNSMGIENHYNNGDNIHSDLSQDRAEQSEDSNRYDNKSMDIGNADYSNDSLISGNIVNNFNINSNDSMGSLISKTKSETRMADDSENERSIVHEIRSDSEEELKAVNMNEESDEIESDEDSSDDERSDCSDVQVREVDDEPVSINSDSEPEAIGDDSSKDSHLKQNKSNSMTADDFSNQGSNKKSDAVEIVSDNDDYSTNNSENANNMDLDSRRRSSRNVGRQTYSEIEDLRTNGESDIEEITGDDPLYHRAKNRNAIVVNDTKKLVDLASRQSKSSSGGQKKEPTVVIIDTNSIMTSKSQLHQNSSKSSNNSFSSIGAQNLYQSIAARGTTVTPVSAKINQNNSNNVTPPILPSLTDDMFVVEAPSFIVPYVYEKPSIKPFREFVDILGKELDEQRQKEDLELEEELKKEKEAQKEAKPPEDDETKSKDQSTDAEKMDVVDVSDDVPRKEGEKKKSRRKRDDDDASWDGESTSDSDDEGLSDEDRPKTVIIKEKEDDSLDNIKDTITATDLTIESKTGKSDNYFENSLGKFFINIGVNLVQEYVQTDLLKQQKRKLYKESRMGSSVKSTESAISSLLKNLEFSKENNAPYKFQQKKCEYCSFKTESALALAHHMETPHMKNNVYKCNFCPYEIRSPHDILFHMEAEHNTRGRLERAPAYHQCANCPFEDNGKGKLARHLLACAKKFKPEHNLAPPVEWEPPAKIPKITRVRHSMMNSYPNSFGKAMSSGLGIQQRPISNMLPQLTPSPSYRGRGRPQVLPVGKTVQGAPLVRGGVVYRPNQLGLPTNYPLLPGGQTSVKPVIPKSLQHQPSISITPLPRAPPPLAPLSPAAAAAVASAVNSTATNPQNKSTFVICEICDGYIKDLEQLRNHMLWIHKVKIHPKMIYNRPPLNCQKCQFRFFTDQGLERHLLGSHGLVTSSMQEAANKGKDAGRCPVCGRVYQWKLLQHVARDHNMTLKPAHLSYKCTVCTATFGMYKQFENHVYSAHSVVAKRAMDRGKPSPASGAPSTSKTAGDSILKPLKINDEITIIPQPAKNTIRPN